MVQILKTLEALQQAVTQTQQHSDTIALVPTMGNLHAGHEALIQKARALADKVMLSIFVNPMQFNMQQDYLSYPVTLEQDICIAQQHGVDYVFAPTAEEIYTAVPHRITLDFPGITHRYCGHYRPGHFQGVLTIISILLHLIRPHYAVFGEKDYQQLRIIQLMAQQLHIPTNIIPVPTVRTAQGLALSSRNSHLAAEEIKQAGWIYHTLHHIHTLLLAHAKPFAQLEQEGQQRLTRKGFRVDYFAIAEAEYLQPAQPQDQNLVILTACHLGKTRLIDNVLCRRT